MGTTCTQGGPSKSLRRGDMQIPPGGGNQLLITEAGTCKQFTSYINLRDSDKSFARL
jgi:hypothetical protein